MDLQFNVGISIRDLLREKSLTFSEQMEITNITGNISKKDGEPYLHDF